MRRKSDSRFILLPLMALMVLFGIGVSVGSAADNIVIDTVEELQKIGHDAAYPLDGGYVLGGDIDASATAGWNDEGTGDDVLEGFEPIGLYESEEVNEGFTGVFDGLGHTITGLTINRPEENGVGLFAYIGGGGQVRGLVMAGVEVNGYDWIGGLAGVNNGMITDCSVDGVVISNGSDVGIMSGFNGGLSAGCQTSGEVMGRYNVGGLAGENTNDLIQCHSNANATGEWHVAGLVGYNNDGYIKKCYATGEIRTDYNGGGLIGRSHYDALVEECYATGNVYGRREDPYRNHGGLIGNNRGDVDRCFATGDVIGYNTLGGLLGRNEGIVTNCYATGSVTKTGPQNAGGLAGYHHAGSIRYCYATGHIEAVGYSGGLAGFALANVTDSFWDTQTTGMLSSRGGGSGLLTAQMMQQKTFSDAGWNFRINWSIKEGESYPTLKVFDAQNPENAVADWLLWE